VLLVWNDDSKRHLLTLPHTYTPHTQEIETSRPQARMHELMKTIVTPAGTTESTSSTEKNILLKFLLRPIQVTCNTAPLPKLPLQTRAFDSALDVKNIDNSTVGAKVYSLQRSKTITGIDLHKTELHGDASEQVAKDIAPPRNEAKANVIHLPCQLLLKSVGYRSVKFLNVPFDNKRSIVPNIRGRVVWTDDVQNQHVAESPAGKDGGINEITAMLNNMLQSDDTDTSSAAPATYSLPTSSVPVPALANAHLAPLYVVGWLKNGPKGTIATSVTDAKDTVSSILADINADSDSGALLHEVTTDPVSSITVLKNKSIVNWSEWQHLESREETMGQKHVPAKPMIKVLNTKEMIMIAKKKK